MPSECHLQYALRGTLPMLISIFGPTPIHHWYLVGEVLGLRTTQEPYQGSSKVADHQGLIEPQLTLTAVIHQMVVLR